MQKLLLVGKIIDNILRYSLSIQILEWFMNNSWIDECHQMKFRIINQKKIKKEYLRFNAFTHKTVWWGGWKVFLPTNFPKSNQMTKYHNYIYLFTDLFQSLIYLLLLLLKEQRRKEKNYCRQQIERKQKKKKKNKLSLQKDFWDINNSKL